MNLEAAQGLGSDKIRNVCLRGNEAVQEVTRRRVLGKVGTHKGPGAPRPPGISPLRPKRDGGQESAVVEPSRKSF